MAEIKFFNTIYEECKNDLVFFRNINRDTRRDQAYLDWRYTQRPCRLKPIIVWAEDSKGTKIGVLSIIPHDFYVHDRVIPLGVLGDISVAKEWRGKGIAVKMFDYLDSIKEVKDLEACVVLPNKEASRPLVKSGWTEVTQLERFVKAIDVGPMINKYLGDNGFSRVISRSVNIMLKAFSPESFFKEKSKYKGVIVTAFDEKFDDLWSKAAKTGMVLGLRNREYLTWRYHRHPIVVYKIFSLLNEGALCGYIVFHHDQNTCHVDDIISLDEEYGLYDLFFSFFKEVRRNLDLFSITVRINKTHPFYSSMEKLGFIKRPDFQEFMVKTSNAENITDLVEGNNWVLTSGDKDV